MRLTSTLLLAGAAAALLACGKGDDKSADTTSMGAGAAADTTGTMGGAAGAGAAGAASTGAAGTAGTAGTTTGAMADSMRMRDSTNRTGTAGTRERTGRTHRP